MSEAPGASSTRETTTAIGAATGAMPRAERPFWREALAPYARPRLGRSLLDLASSVLPYLVLSALMYLALDVSYLLALALAVPAAGFLLRTYIVFHDCAHGSFLPSKRANAWLGVALGLVVYEAFVSWRHSHAVHHATAQVQRDFSRWPEGQYHGLGRLGHRAWLDHHSGTRQLPRVFGKYGNAREAEDQ